jgi:hypothetical protein
MRMALTRLRSGWLGLGEGPITAKFSRIPLETVGVFLEAPQISRRKGAGNFKPPMRFGQPLSMSGRTLETIVSERPVSFRHPVGIIPFLNG